MADGSRVFGVPQPSPAARTHAAEHAAHLAELQRHRWRVGVVDGSWRVAKYTEGVGWSVLDDALEHLPDIDPAAETYRVVSWTRELIGYRTAVQWRDYAAAEQGRLVYDLQINS